jgi:putative hemolysin
MTTLLLSAPGPATTGAPAYTLRLAAHADEVAAAQRLRHDVFAGEIGARLHTLLPGHDVDAFDEFCDHLIVIDERDGAVVGTYRLLPPGRTENRYAADEFDIDALSPIAASLVETGRSCIHPAHRSGAVINLIWAGIARYMHLYGYRYVGGCASVDVRAGDTTANAVWSLARSRYASPEPWRVRPYRAMDAGRHIGRGGRTGHPGRCPAPRSATAAGILSTRCMALRGARLRPRLRLCRFLRATRRPADRRSVHEALPG